MATVPVPRPPRISASERARQLALVRSAIDLIAAGGADRVTLVGLRSAERVLPQAQALSEAAGLSARATWLPDGDGCDIIVEDLQ
jgi:hypothetical protein